MYVTSLQKPTNWDQTWRCRWGGELSLSQCLKSLWQSCVFTMHTSCKHSWPFSSLPQHCRWGEELWLVLGCDSSHGCWHSSRWKSLVGEQELSTYSNPDRSWMARIVMWNLVQVRLREASSPREERAKERRAKRGRARASTGLEDDWKWYDWIRTIEPSKEGVVQAQVGWYGGWQWWFDDLTKEARGEPREEGPVQAQV